MMTLFELEAKMAEHEDIIPMEKKRFPQDEINRILKENNTDEWLEAADNIVSNLQR